jgi:hypothetical protein
MKVTTGLEMSVTLDTRFRKLITDKWQKTDLDSEESFQVMSFQFVWMTGRTTKMNLSQCASRTLRYTELLSMFVPPSRMIKLQMEDL